MQNRFLGSLFLKIERETPCIPNRKNDTFPMLKIVEQTQTLLSIACIVSFRILMIWLVVAINKQTAKLLFSISIRYYIKL